MGTICAPAYANIFTADLNKNTFIRRQKTDQFFSYAVLMVFLWHGPNLKNSQRNGSKTPLYNFDYKFHSYRIAFLDILAYIDQQNKVQATLF